MAITGKLRIALVGLGDIAQKAWLPIVCQHPEVEPIFCTRNSDTLSRLAQQYRIKETYTDINDAINAAPDAIMIHSATESHFEIASASIKAGIATLIDKPISDNFEQVNQLINLAKANNTPLCTGFNRRFAPLLQPLKTEQLNHLRWQKNRHNLPGNIRQFIFDDFIHVVDSLLYFGRPATPIEPQIHFVMKQQQLAAVFLRIASENTLIEGSMNRISGQTFERIEAFSDNQHWQVDNLRQGQHFSDNMTNPMLFSDWQSTLYKRGFDDLLDSWLSQIKKGQPQHDYLDSLLTTHQLCERIVKYIEAKTNE
ncbi:Gfo/Idh/MocA family oxidoreductase [Motilimonas cestriensis]|uniref:Gfo/Idh/MocA family oxidoreductase n=1 Tax=Motilimonas cestriensis TaxID=2742685 RepID=A0ABS8WDT5_9GAMM|nr:Gfo/Idh/MocA family oxidoreductase [Motilimonas cestriensis]MCE2596292.1 Gfo/Idh/MocA family oxidoreductase [Motilimonas cestriensis]